MLRAGQSSAFQKWKCLVQEEQEPETITLGHLLRGIRTLQRTMESYEEHLHHVTDRLSQFERGSERDDTTFRNREHEPSDPRGQQADSRRKSSMPGAQLGTSIHNAGTQADVDSKSDRRQVNLHRTSLTDSMVLVPTHGLMKSSSQRDLKGTGTAGGREAAGDRGKARGWGAIYHAEPEAASGEHFQACAVAPLLYLMRDMPTFSLRGSHYLFGRLLT